MTPSLIALVGDYNPEVVAHRAIEKCFSLARQLRSRSIESQWVYTESIVPGDAGVLKPFSGIWCVPASPYKNTEGALWAIHYARTRSIPFLGTCGGYQQALLEYARNVLGLKSANRAEIDPTASLPLLDRMECDLIEQSQKVVVTDTEFQRVYGAASGLEGFHCFGLNPKYEHLFAESALEIVARSEDGQARALRLKEHPFFVGAQFQPECRSLTGSIHPLIAAFFSAAERRKSHKID
jgi:CTP synthase (UTP-ammonia lyase)